MLLAYVMFIFGFASESADSTIFAGGIVGIALGLVPGVFVVAAFVSQHPQAIRATLLACLVWAVVAIPIAVVNLPLGLVAGFGAGGAVAFRRDPWHSNRLRLTAVAACALYTALLQVISPAAGILGGAPLPFFAIAVADTLRDRSVDT